MNAHLLEREPVGRSRRRVRGRWRFVRDVAIILIVAMAASFLIKTFVVRTFYIPSASMENTLQINDRILVDQVTPKLAGLHRGDIVVFTDPGGWLNGYVPAPQNPLDAVMNFVGLAASDSANHLVKRVIGLPGDRVTCCNALGQLAVNGAPIREPYTRLPPGQVEVSLQAFAETVPKGSLWVMGDNRDNSADSRSHIASPGGGFVPIENVVGRAFAISWPTGRWRLLDGGAAPFDAVR